MNVEGETPRVVELPADADVGDLERGTYYRGRVNGVVPYGVFVDLSEEVSGLIHESNLESDPAVGDELVVELETVRENGDVSLIETPYEPPTDVDEPTAIDAIDPDQDGATVIGRVVQVKETGGPMIIYVTDGTGVISGAAFEEDVDGEAMPVLGDHVRMTGRPESHGRGFQLEVETVATLDADAATTTAARIEDTLADHTTPPTLDPLVEWETLGAIYPRLESLASAIQRAVLTHRPIRIRHHADGDGICSAVPLELAIERYIAATHADPTDAEFLVTRAPSRAPYYEMEDATRDLNRALGDRDRHGQRLPMLLMLDNGSTAEDVPAYRNLAHYDIPIAVVDHHSPDTDAVAPLLTEHVNPYLVDGDYALTTGMLCVELARLIDPPLSGALEHVPAVAGVADRSAADAMDEYLAFAAEAGYDRDTVTRIGEALDFASHWLRYNAGTPVVREILGVDPDVPEDRQGALVDLLSTKAREAIDRQLEAAMAHVSSRPLANDATLHRIDLDRFAHRFDYPAPGRTTGAIHDRKAVASGDPTVTLGYGPDFCVLRSDGVRLDIPAMVSDLQEAVPGAGVTGGGHLVVGSVKFVPGRREAVIDALIEMIAKADIDEALGSTAELPDQDDFAGANST